MAKTNYRIANRATWVGVRPAHEGTEFAKGDEFNGNGVSIIYTVPADTTLYLTSWAYAAYTVANKRVLLRVRNAADVSQYWIYHFKATDNGQVHIGGSLWPPLELPTGFDIYFDSNSSSSKQSCSLRGWTE